MSKAAIFNIKNDNCCSCFLCNDVCTHKAISMELNSEGFYRPIVNKESCTDCGLCNLMCPINNNVNRNESYSEPINVLGAWTTNDQVRINSSSGGLFYEIASNFILKGGKVCGVKWSNGKPTFDIASNIDELKLFMGSKYLQADASGVYKAVKTLIKHNEKVLFSGLPCQIQAVSNYIKSPNLYLIDIVCAGVPSMKMFQSYCEETFPDSEISHVNFRRKKNDSSKSFLSSWRNYYLEYFSSDRLLLSQVHFDNHFFQAFNSTKCYNKSCYSCPFNTIPRRGDITLCDFWGASGSKEKLDGTSIIIMNNAHGNTLFNSFINDNPSLLSFTDISLDEAQNGTKRINMGSRSMPDDRALIFSYLNSYGFKVMYNRLFYRSLSKRLLERIRKMFF